MYTMQSAERPGIAALRKALSTYLEKTDPTAVLSNGRIVAMLVPIHVDRFSDVKMFRREARKALTRAKHLIEDLCQ